MLLSPCTLYIIEIWPCQELNFFSNCLLPIKKKKLKLLCLYFTVGEHPVGYVLKATSFLSIHLMVFEKLKFRQKRKVSRRDVGYQIYHICEKSNLLHAVISPAKNVLLKHRVKDQLKEKHMLKLSCVSVVDSPAIFLLYVIIHQMAWISCFTNGPILHAQKANSQCCAQFWCHFNFTNTIDQPQGY